MDQAWIFKNEAIKASWKIKDKIKDGCIQLWKILQAPKNTINNSKDNKYLPNIS